MLDKRSIRIFVSSTFKDMIEDRNQLMTHAWPELRKFCHKRHVELVEIDLRWGITEEQSTRKETLKLCLDEIRACRPFFIGMLGERYGWTPDKEPFTNDLMEEQPWLKEMGGKSVTELEILHGVLNNPEMAQRAFFYFRDSKYAASKGDDFLAETAEKKKLQKSFKDFIRNTCVSKDIPLHENYPNPQSLASLVLKDLKDAIDTEFPMESIPDSLDRDAYDHEAFAEIRRRTYIGRADYFDQLDQHANNNEAPLILLGESGSGKSSLLANWIEHWREKHPQDFIFQHYIGGTSDSATHWKLMNRLMAEVKRWTNDEKDIPKSKENILRDFPMWLSNAHNKAEHEGVRFIVILDALNQLDDQDHSRLLSWLPNDAFAGSLRLVVSTLSSDTLEVIEKYNWEILQVEALDQEERAKMVVNYLERFGKTLKESHLKQLSDSEVCSNPLFLKILLDELRVTGTYEGLEEHLADYLAAVDIPSLLRKVLGRYERDYERDRPGLVADALGLIRASRRGLTEAELLHLLKPKDLLQLPSAIWAPFRAAIEDSMVDRAGVLNFAHSFLGTAVESVFQLDLANMRKLRIKLSDYFEAQAPTSRSADELPWLLKQTDSFDRLRKCLLNIDHFLEIIARDNDELRQYWADLGYEQSLETSYVDSFNNWGQNTDISDTEFSFAASKLGSFLSFDLSLHKESEYLFTMQ